MGSTPGKELGLVPEKPTMGTLETLAIVAAVYALAFIAYQTTKSERAPT